MIGIGTLINTTAIIIGGIIGLYCGKIMKENYQNTIMKATGICVIFIGIGGTIENMMTIQNGKITSNGTMMMITSIVIGSLIGEILDIELHIEQFGQWLKNKTGNVKDSSFVEGKASLNFRCFRSNWERGKNKTSKQANKQTYKKPQLIAI